MEKDEKLIGGSKALSSNGQTLVEQVAEALETHPKEKVTFREALDEFKSRHPELLKLLSQ